MIETLIFDMLQWLDAGDRTYEEVMDTWHTSCPRLQVWEEVNLRAYVKRELYDGDEVIRLTTEGTAELRKKLFHEMMCNYLKVSSR